MPGFLDPLAVSYIAEYARYLDADILGKILFKNFAQNVLGTDEKAVRVALSRHGDQGAHKDSSDAEIRYKNRSYVIETKISRWVVQKRNKLNPIPRWAFSGLKHSATGTQRGKYDVVFAAGINAPGLEDSEAYWRHLGSLKNAAKLEGRDFDLSAWPHKREFLSQCGFYILPRPYVFAHCKNKPYITIRSIPGRPDYEYFAWGYQESRLREIWQRALKEVNSASVADLEG